MANRSLNGETTARKNVEYHSFDAHYAYPHFTVLLIKRAMVVPYLTSPYNTIPCHAALHLTHSTFSLFSFHV